MAEGKLRTVAAQDGHFLNFTHGSEDLRPPYQLRRMDMIFAVGHWPDGAPLPPLPEGLSPSSSRTGVIGLYKSEDSRGLAPCRLLFGGVTVQETHAPDGTQAAYLFHGEVEGPAADLLPRYVNSNYRKAEVSLHREPDALRGEALVSGGAGRFALTLHPDPATRQINAGTNYYIGMLNGAATGFSIAYSMTSEVSQVGTFTLDLPEGHPFQVFRPFVFDLCLALSDMSMTYGQPFPLELASPTRASSIAPRHELDSLTTGTLDIFARIGRPLAIVDDRGRVLYANAGAERILDRLSGDGPHRLAPHGHASWEHHPPSADGIRLILRLADGATVAVRVMPISLRLSDRPALLVLLDDPAELGPFDPGVLLRLYGLTPSEARLAVLVGQGSPPASAAKALGITGETARTGLKVVFGKLGINRQAELARIVARLEML